MYVLFREEVSSGFFALKVSGIFQHIEDAEKAKEIAERCQKNDFSYEEAEVSFRIEFVRLNALTVEIY